MNPESIEGFGPVGTNGPQPVSILVPIGAFSEPDLIGALDCVMQRWLAEKHPRASDCAVTARAARWLYDKYGSAT